MDYATPKFNVEKKTFTTTPSTQTRAVFKKNNVQVKSQYTCKTKQTFSNSLKISHQ